MRARGVCSSWLFISLFSLCTLVPSTAFAWVTADDGVPPETLLGRSSLGTRDSAGAFTYDIPIVVPPGRNGFQPDLKFIYNNRDTDINNLFGYGWSINIPYIQRINKTGVEDLYNDYYFNSSLDGELATTSPSTTSSFAPLVENGSFNSYIFSNNVWTVYDKQGTRYSFGTTTASRQDNVASSTQVYTWFLDEIRDTNDNYIKYEYAKDNGQVYPSRIIYTGNGPTDGIFKVEFSRTSRNDTATTSAPGFDVITKNIINQIDVKTDDVLTKRYTFSQTTGDNGVRLMLSSIAEVGYTEAGISTSLPATSFSYSTSTKRWTHDTNYNIPLIFSKSGLDQGVRLGDVNGDGLLDLIKGSYDNSNGTVREVYTHRGDQSGWVLDSNYTVPIDFTYNERDRGVFVDDINGDGYVDILQSFKDLGGTIYENVYINKKDGTGWNLVSTTSIPVLFLNHYTYQGVRTADANGDGLTDLVQSYNNSGTTAYGVYLGNGDGTWTQDSSYTIPIDFQQGTADVGSRMVDINNDNLTDIVQSFDGCGSGSTKGVYLNKGDGTGWTLVSTSSPQVVYTACNKDLGVRLADVNGDNLLDQVKFYMPPGGPEEKEFLVSTGNGLWPHDGSSYYIQHGDYFAYDGKDYGTRFVDVDGDGMADSLRSYKVESTETKNLYLHSGVKPDLLVGVTLSEGGSINVTYKNSTKYTDASTGKPVNRELPLVLTTMESVGRNDGFGTVSTTTYAYGGGAYYFNTTLDRKFAGFATTTITDAAGNITKEYRHQGNVSLSSIGEYSDHVSKANKVYRVESYDSSNNLFKKVISKWDRYSQAANRDVVQMVRSLESLFDGDADHKDKAQEFAYASSTTGNLTQKVDWGEVTGDDAGTFTDTGTDKFTFNYTYASTTARNLIGRVATEVQNDQNSTKVSEKRHYYDGLSLENINLGNETKTELWKNSSNYASTTRTYNSYGLITQERDPLYNLTTHVYERFNLHPATTTNALSHVTGKTYDYSSGRVKVVIDPNGRQFETTYDGLDRPLEEKQPIISSPNSLVTKKAYTYTDTSGAKKVIETNYLDGSTDFANYTYFDGLNRKVQTRKEAETASEFTVRDITYNNLGLTYRESLPYFSSGSARTTATSTAALYSTYLYDALKRITAIGTAVGTTTNTYDQWITTITDAESNSKNLTNDAFGNLTQIVENEGANAYTTAYTYNGLNSLTKITDAVANVRNFTYDGMGRRLTAEDLHAVADGTYGTWTYTYDDVGNITSQVDPKSQTVNFTYDDINRPLTENYTGTGGTEATYEYDSCTEGVTRLCSAIVLNSATTTYAYNAVGGIATTTKIIAGTSYITGFSYDRQNNPLLIIHPNNATTRYTYNTAGLLETVESKDPGAGSFSTLVSNLDYAPIEQISYKLFGNDIESTYTFDASKLYRLTNIYTAATSTGESLMGGGGGDELAMADNFWSSLARATAYLPLAQFLLESETEPVNESEITVQDSVLLDNPFVIESATLPVEEIPVSEPIFPATIAGSIEQLLIGKSGEERATIKGQEIAKQDFLGRIIRGSYELEIIDVNEVPEGVQAYARVWNNGQAVGFGFDGTVEIERFRFFNPPVLVDDPNGQIIRRWKDEKGVERERRLREDPKEVLLQALEDAISVVGKSGEKIQEGKVGNTTSTFYSATGANSPIDGTFSNNGSNHTTVRDASASASVNTTEASRNIWINYYEIADAPNVYSIGRGMFGFDIASIGSDTISSATFSVSGNGQATENANSETLTIVSATPAANNTLTTGDFDQFGTTTYATKTVANYSSTDGTYNNFTLDASGRTYVDSWNTIGFLGARMLGDINDTTPTGGNAVIGYMADQTGTTKDPKLVLEHNTNNAPTAPTSLQTEGQTNPTNISDSTPEFTAIYNDNDAGDIATDYHIQVATSTDFGSFLWNTGKTALASSTSNGSRIADISYAGTALASTTTYYWRIKFWDTATAEGTWNSATSTFALSATVNNAPTAPTALQTEGLTNPTILPDQTPEFSARYEDSVGDQAIYYQLQVATSSSYWGAPKWDSSQTTMATTTEGSRSPQISYSGTALTPFTTYYWRIKFWDVGGLEGDWSTATSSFSVRAGAIQDISFTYDTVGNITEMLDNSVTSANKIVVFTYDDLYRLTSASTTAATSTPYKRTYTYSGIGNITSASDLGTYVYGETSYTNPHAVTAVGTGVSTTTYAYDNNGNLTTGGSWTYTFDYRNRLTQASNGSASTYTYDHGGQRVKKTSGGVSTVYPDKYLNVAGATTTIQVYDATGSLIATIEGNGVATTTDYIHPDHLGSTNAVTDSTGEVIQTLDYYPYGSKRIESSSDVSQREFIGQHFDEETDLSYLNARYYENARGQFQSQDPTFLAIGSPKLTEVLMRANGQPNSSFRAVQIEKEKDRQILQQFLADPQLMNSYGYARNNPVRYSDPTGEAIPLLPIFAIYSVAQSLINLYEAKTVFVDYPEVFSAQEKYQTAFRIGLDTALFGAGRATKDVGQRALLQVAPAVLDVMDHYFGQQIYQGINSNQSQSQTSSSAFVSSGYNATQTSAISSLAKSFGVSSLSSNQVNAIVKVQKAFNSKKE